MFVCVIVSMYMSYAYIKYHIIQHDQPFLCISSPQRQVSADVISCSAAISACEKDGRWAVALKILRSMYKLLHQDSWAGLCVEKLFGGKHLTGFQETK